MHQRGVVLGGGEAPQPPRVRVLHALLTRHVALAEGEVAGRAARGAAAGTRGRAVPPRVLRHVVGGVGVGGAPEHAAVGVGGAGAVHAPRPLEGEHAELPRPRARHGPAAWHQGDSHIEHNQ